MYMYMLQASGFSHPGLQKVTRPQLYCHLASNPIVNATSKRLSTRPNDLTLVLVYRIIYMSYVYIYIYKPFNI